MSNVEFTFDHFWKIDIFVCTAIFKIASEGCSKSKLCDHKVEVETVFNQLSRVGNTNILFITFPRVCVRGARCSEAQLADLAAAWSGGLLGISCYDQGENVV